jgi:DNA-binding transcriptional ArsR family regulator
MADRNAGRHGTARSEENRTQEVGGSNPLVSTKAYLSRACEEVSSDLFSQRKNSWTKCGVDFPLDIYAYMGIYFKVMARAATTTDAFNAIAEPRRRAIIDALVDGRAHAVGEVVERLRIPQPAVSKHLGVLRKVGIVSVSKHGQLRLYRLNAKELKPVHDWVKTYERYWGHQLDRIKERAERKMTERSARESQPAKDKEERSC